MRSNSKQGFVLSVLLHASVVVVVVAVSLYKPPEKPKPHVFELVSPPPPSEQTDAEDAVQFVVPQSRPAPVIPPQPRPQPPPPKPEPVQQPKPVVQQTKPKPVPEKPKPEPEKPKPTTTLAEYLKQNPQKPQPQRTTAPKPVNVPRIDTKFSAKLRQTMIDYDSITLSDAEQSQLDSYIARLREALRRAWDKPSGLARTTSATADFDVAANGRISGMRINRSSGNASYDQSVLDAISRVGSAGPPPDGRAHPLRLTFDIEE